LQKHLYKIAFIIALLLHLLFIVLYRPLTVLLQLFPHSQAKAAETQPLVFEFEQPRELVETPDDAQVDKAPQDAQFLSDKNARAQDNYQANDLPRGLSYSEGLTDHKIFSGGGQPGQQMEAPQSERPSDEMDMNDADNTPADGEQNDPRDGDVQLSRQQQQQQPRTRFSRDLLYGRQSTVDNGPVTFSDDVNWNNRESSVVDEGGISLSTYEWNYAPFLLYLKRRVRDHVYPPAAFYQLGLISGEVMLKFTIYRDGSITEPQLLSSKGHDSFISTSMNAVKAGSPYKRLPDDFPEDKLDLTWTFIYTIYK